jgi:integrase
MDFCRIDLQLSEATVDSHSRYVKEFLGLTEESIEFINIEDIRGFLARFKDKNPNTYANVLKALKIFFRDFLNKPELVQSFKFPYRCIALKHIPSKEELKKFYEAIPSLKYKAMFLLYASSGLRLSEVLKLKVSDLDFESKSIRVKHSSRTKKAWISFFNEEAKQVLLDYIKTQNLNVNDFLFRSGKHRGLKGFQKAKNKTGLNITPQVLREWFCSEVARLGVPDRYVDAFCGRVPRSILARHYTDYSPERLKEIYDKANLKVLS